MSIQASEVLQLPVENVSAENEWDFHFLNPEHPTYFLPPCCSVVARGSLYVHKC